MSEKIGGRKGFIEKVKAVSIKKKKNLLFSLRKGRGLGLGHILYTGTNAKSFAKIVLIPAEFDLAYFTISYCTFFNRTW